MKNNLTHLKKENMMKAEVITGDLKENTMTFEIQGKMILKAGEYVILTKEEYEELEKK